VLKSTLKNWKLDTDENTPDVASVMQKFELESSNELTNIISFELVYKAARVENPFAQELGTYNKGISCHIATVNQQLGLKLRKGKAVLKPKALEII